MLRKMHFVKDLMYVSPQDVYVEALNPHVRVSADRAFVKELGLD